MNDIRKGKNPKDQNELNAIDRLEKELYAQNQPSILRKSRHSLDSQKTEARENWPEIEKKAKKKFHFSQNFLRRSLFFSILFSIVAVSLAMVAIFFGFNRISSDKVIIDVKGLSAIESGQELSLDVSVVNKNRILLEDVVLILEYPDGTRDPMDLQKPILRQEEIVGVLSPKDGRFSRVFNSVLFGPAQSIKEIKILVQYKTREGRSVFAKEEIYKVELRSAPISVSVLASPEARSGQEIESRISIISNSTSVLKNLMLIAEYPPEFSFTQSLPEPSFDNRIWIIGDLEPRGRAEIVLRGIIGGQDGDEKNFRYFVGIQSQNDERIIGTELLSHSEPVFIRQPALALRMDIEGTQSGEYISKLGNTVRGQINWRNNLPDGLSDVSINLSFAGNGWDRASVSPDRRGFYRSQENLIIWDKNTFADFLKIRSGQSGTLDFSFAINKFNARDLENLKNSSVKMTATIKGTRLLEGRSPEEIIITSMRDVKVETDLSVVSRAVYSVGPFANSGPLPPKAESSTTYTIIWSLSNNINEVADIEVGATLPVYVEWLNRVSPSSADLKFDPNTRTVKWNISRILPGQGISNAPLEAAFQVRFSPSLGQVNDESNLVGEVLATGRDIFVGREVSDRNPPATIRITTDPIYSFQMGRVVAP